jgi:Zn finger protein HypA/HybF involved in hydrogenase expression
MLTVEKMKYKCLKCGNEFDAQFEVKCPKCGAKDWDCEPIRKYSFSQPETVQVPATGEK